MFKLAPSLLSADFSKLEKEIRKIERAGAHYLHLDVMDGQFVPNISFGAAIIKSIRDVTNMTFDVHMMVYEPEKLLEPLAEAGADILNVHFEVCENIKETIFKIKSLQKNVAVTIKPTTEIDNRFLEIVELVDMVLVMSVEPGFSGQEFIPESLKKAETLANFISSNNLITEIEMDGGIVLSNLRDVLNAGVNIVVAGSSVFGKENVEDAVKDFYNVFKEFKKE